MNVNRESIVLGIIIIIIDVVMFWATILTTIDAKCAPVNWLDACNPYRKDVTRWLVDEGVSASYYYLMVAESHCTPSAVSSKGALGFWQMMPATMKYYGCFNAHDLECQTRSAARYIKSLESRFRTFNDVVIAYNMGGHNYKRLGKTSESKGLEYTVMTLKRIDDTKCECTTSSSVEIIDDDGQCIYWYETVNPQKKNPCDNVPDNAMSVKAGVQ